MCGSVRLLNVGVPPDRVESCPPRIMSTTTAKLRRLVSRVCQGSSCATTSTAHERACAQKQSVPTVSILARNVSWTYSTGVWRACTSDGLRVVFRWKHYGKTFEDKETRVCRRNVMHTKKLTLWPTLRPTKHAASAVQSGCEESV